MKSVSKIHDLARDVHERAEELLRLVRKRYMTVDDCMLALNLAEGLYYAAERTLEEARDPHLDYIPME